MNLRETACRRLLSFARLPTLIGALLSFLLVACGGGAGQASVDYRISVSPGAVTFTGTSNVPAASITVRVSYKGDGVIAGYAPGVQTPDWLSISQGETTASTVDFILGISRNKPAGTYNTSVRFVTGKADGSEVRFVDLPVRYEVTEASGAGSASGSGSGSSADRLGTSGQDMPFSGLRNAPSKTAPAAGYPLQIFGNGVRWHVSADKSWVQLSATSGTGAATVQVTANVAGQPIGTQQAIVTITNDDDSSQRATYASSLAVHAAKLVLQPAQASFTIDANTLQADLTKSITVTDELDGSVSSESVSWTLDSVTPSWLAWSRSSGSSAPSTQAQLSVDANAINTLPSGKYTGSVTLKYSNAEVSNASLSLPIAIDLKLGIVQFVAPYIGLSNQAGKLFVRGKGFDTGYTGTLDIGSQTASAYKIDSTTQAQLSYPALAAGRYLVKFRNALGLTRSTGELVVVDTLASATQTLSAPSQRQTMVYDAERLTLYAVNRTDQEIEIYKLSGQSWTASNPLVIPDLTDIAMTPNGRSLIVTTRGDIKEIDLRSTPLKAVQRAVNPDTFCGGYFQQLAMSNTGRALVVFDLSSCSGYTASYLYDATSYQLTGNPYFDGYLYNGLVGGSADGSRIYAGSNGLSPAPEVKIFNALDDAITNSAVSYNLNAVSVSGDASKVVLQETEVYSRSLSLLGHLGAGRSVVSPDGSRAYVYLSDKSQPRVDVYDLNGALQSGALFPKLKTMVLPGNPGGTSNTDIRLLVTPDNRTLFVSGPSAIVIQPL